jgi:hypothetical protein
MDSLHKKTVSSTHSADSEPMIRITDFAATGRGLSATQAVDKDTFMLAERALVVIKDTGDKLGNSRAFSLAMEQPRNRPALGVLRDMTNAFEHSDELSLRDAEWEEERAGINSSEHRLTAEELVRGRFACFPPYHHAVRLLLQLLTKP